MCCKQREGFYVFVQASEQTADTVTHKIYRQGPIITAGTKHKCENNRHRERTRGGPRGLQYNSFTVLAICVFPLWLDSSLLRCDFLLWGRCVRLGGVFTVTQRGGLSLGRRQWEGR